VHGVGVVAVGEADTVDAFVVYLGGVFYACDRGKIGSGHVGHGTIFGRVAERFLRGL
jgi:hypothetical protein